jgi:hypothetical protein
MLPLRKTLWLVVLGVLAAGASSVQAQHWSPFGPSEVRYDFEMFKAPDLSTYPNPKSNHGIFLQYDRLYWGMSKPASAQIGSTTAAPAIVNSYTGLPFPGVIPPPFAPFPDFNSVDTGHLTGQGGWGNRWEIGYMDPENVGWMVSILDHVQQNQTYFFQDVQLQFDDPGQWLQGYTRLTTPLGIVFVDQGKMVTAFDNLSYANSTTLGGVELVRMNRGPVLHGGGFFDVLYGARWFQLGDRFTVLGSNGDPADPLNTITYINPLGNSFWNTETENNLVGPEIGLRWFRQKGRWKTTLEGRFLTAANFQNYKQRTVLGDQISTINDLLQNTDNVVIPRRFYGLGTNSELYSTVFSPLGEWRASVSCQLSKAFSIRVGYTGMVVGNVARASNSITYNTEQLVGIKKNRETFFVNGLDFGVEFNR